MADDRKKQAAAESLAPTPTQEEIDKGIYGDKPPEKRQAKEKEAVEALAPTPTQEESDTIKNGGVPLEKRTATPREAPPEALPPTPTQMENDLAKLAAMNLGSIPEGGGDPQMAKEAEAKKKKDMEASKPSPASYQTKSAS